MCLVAPVTTVELVRHAKAGRRDAWERADWERPLTKAGWAQAQALARCLEDPIAALHSSPFVRCVQTLEPLASRSGLPILHEDALSEATTLRVHDHGDAWVMTAWLAGRALALIDRLAAEHADGRVVLCSHGDVIPALMALLTGRDGLALDDVGCPKGARFTLAFDGQVCKEATLHPAP